MSTVTISFDKYMYFGKSFPVMGCCAPQRTSLSIVDAVQYHRGRASAVVTLWMETLMNNAFGGAEIVRGGERIMGRDFLRVALFSYYKRLFTLQ